MNKIALLFFLLTTATSHAQNYVVFAQPYMHSMYTGYANAVEIGFTEKQIKNITVECDFCESVQQNTSNPNQWIVRVGTTDALTILVKNKKGEVIGQQRYYVFSPPNPTISLNTGGANDLISEIPTSLIVKYPSSVPLTVKFLVRSWQIKIGDRTFSGSRQLTKEVIDHLESVKSGTMIIIANCLGPTGEMIVKEIFEFDLE
jgi:hypothetical protein